MKKLYRSCILFFLSFVLVFSNVTAFAEIDGTQEEWQDISLSQEEFESVLSNNLNNTVAPYALELILVHAIGIQKSGNTLIIAGKTMCDLDVVKCGFKEVIIQRKTSSATSWSDYQKYTDLYADLNQYVLSKSITVPSGYQYRVICTHYAKKNLLSTQKIDNTSNIVSF